MKSGVVRIKTRQRGEKRGGGVERVQLSNMKHAFI